MIVKSQAQDLLAKRAAMQQQNRTALLTVRNLSAVGGGIYFLKKFFSGQGGD